jgi:hypothetical protein
VAYNVRNGSELPSDADGRMDTTCSTAIKTYLTASAKSGALLRRLVALAFRGPVPVGVVDALVLVSLASDFRLVLSPASEPGPNEPTEPGPAEPVPSADLRARTTCAVGSERRAKPTLGRHKTALRSSCTHTIEPGPSVTSDLSCTSQFIIDGCASGTIGAPKKPLQRQRKTGKRTD